MLVLKSHAFNQLRLALIKYTVPVITDHPNEKQKTDKPNVKQTK